MGYVGHQSRRRFPSRVEEPTRERAQPPRVSTILCLMLGGMALLALVGKAFTHLFAAI